mgnify:CR=1 FL=1|jgi:hypothetical protein
MDILDEIGWWCTKFKIRKKNSYIKICDIYIILYFIVISYHIIFYYEIIYRYLWRNAITIFVFVLRFRFIYQKLIYYICCIDKDIK